MTAFGFPGGPSGRRIVMGLASLLVACSSRRDLPAPQLPLTPSTADPFRRSAPRLNPATVVAPPAVRTGVLDNGMSWAVVERPDLPSVTLAYASQTAHDGGVYGRAGLSLLTATLIREMAVSRKAGWLRELGISSEGLELSVLPAGTLLTVNTFADEVGAAVRLLSKALQNPLNDSAAFDRVRVSQQALLRRYTAQTRVREAALTGLYGTGTYASLPPAGRNENLEHFVLADAQRARDLYAPSHSILIAVGATTAEEVQREAQEAFGAWRPPKRSEEERAPLASVRARSEPVVYLLPKILDTSHFTVALPCASRQSPDHLPLVLAAMMLGGTARSRAGTQLRHERGMSYATGASCETRAGTAEFLIEGAVDQDRTGEALALILTEIQQLRSTPAAGGELEVAKARYLGTTAARLATNTGTTEAIADLFLSGLPLDYYSSLEAAVRDVTPERLRKAAHAYLRADRLSIAIDGEQVTLQRDLARFGQLEWLGP